MSTSRTLGSIALSLVATLVFSAPAAARNLSYSAGNGVKCYYVLVSSVNGTNTYQTVCRKSGV
jgi:hypothetical protein